MSVYEPSVQSECGIASATPVFHVFSLEAATRFYMQLGFEVRRYDPTYAYAQREGLTIHLRASPDHEPLNSNSEIYVETSAVDDLHHEWHALDLMPVRTIVTPDMRAELRRRWAADDPMGLISDRVKDQPWGVREFSIRDPDGNKLRFGRRRTGAQLRS